MRLGDRSEQRYAEGVCITALTSALDPSFGFRSEMPELTCWEGADSAPDQEKAEETRQPPKEDHGACRHKERG